MTTNQSFGLSLSVLSFDLPPNLVKNSDDIRVSITTIPEQNKQAFIIPAKKMKNPYLNFKFNVKIPSEYIPKDFVSTGTEKILITFRKKSFFYADPIIAFTIISVNELPKNFTDPIITKTIDIFKHVQKESNSKNNNISSDFALNENTKNNKKRVGNMKIKMTLTDPIQLDCFDNDQFVDIKENETLKYTQNKFGFQKL